MKMGHCGRKWDMQSSMQLRKRESLDFNQGTRRKWNTQSVITEAKAVDGLAAA